MAATITKLNHKEVHSLIELAKKLGVKRFMYFNVIPTGRGSENTELDLTPIEREKLLKQLYAESRTTGIKVLSTAPQYARVVLQQSEGHDAAPNHFYLGINQGNELKQIAEEPALGYFDDPATSDIDCTYNAELWEEVSLECDHNRTVNISPKKVKYIIL